MPYKVQKWNRPHPPNSAGLRLELEAEGYTVFHLCDRPEMQYGLHKHSDDQCHWIISGSLEINIDHGGTFVLECGDRDLMPAETYHSARVLGDEPVVYLVGSRSRSAEEQGERVDGFELLRSFAEMMRPSEDADDETCAQEEEA